MVSDTLVQYVNQTRKEFSDEDIRKKLKGAGHSDDDIQAAFAAAEPRADAAAPKAEKPAPTPAKEPREPMSREKKMLLSGLIGVLIVLVLVLVQKLFF